jgi:hypothetical protein
MADRLFLNLWFPSFSEAEMCPRLLAVLRQFPFSKQRPGITYLAVHPVGWSESTVLEQRFEPGVEPDAAIAVAAEILHDDYAYVFEASWDLWMPKEQADETEEEEFVPAPLLVKFIAHGLEFEDHFYQQAGHVQVDFGVDAPFLYEDQIMTPALEARFRANVQKLVMFTNIVEKNSGISGRVLWSESDENLAQKLIERLQRIQ